MSVAQQIDELAMLTSLAAPPQAAAASAGGAPQAPADPAAQLAAWLLNQARLSSPA